MAIEFIGAGTQGAGTAGVTPTLHASSTTDDLIILVIEGEGEDANDDAPPTGGAWTKIGSIASATGGAVDNTRCSAYWAWYSASLNRSVPDAGDHTLARLYTFRGVDPTTPLDGVTPTTGSNATNATSHSAATGITSATDNAWVLLAYSHGDDALSPSSHANTSLTGVAAGGAASTSSGSDGTCNVIYGLRASAGTGGTFTWSTGATEENAWIAFVLRPAATPLSASSSDAMSLGESPTRQADFTRSDANAMAMSEATTRAAAFARSTADAMAMGESFAYVLAKHFAAAASDALALGEAFASVISKSVSSTDAMALGETAARIGAFQRSIADALVLGDAASRQVDYSRAGAEALVLGEAAARSAAFGRSFSEPLIFGESLARSIAFVRSAADAIVMGDNAGATVEGEARYGSATDALELGEDVFSVLEAEVLPPVVEAEPPMLGSWAFPGWSRRALPTVVSSKVAIRGHSRMTCRLRGVARCSSSMAGGAHVNLRLAGVARLGLSMTGGAEVSSRLEAWPRPDPQEEAELLAVFNMWSQAE